MPDTRHEFTELFDIYVVVGTAVFLVIVALVAFVVLRFRIRSHEPAGTVSHAQQGRASNKPAELGFAAFVALIVAGLLYFTYDAMSDLDAAGRRGEGPLVEVTAAKWNWRFAYPEYGIVQAEGGSESAELVVPVDTPVRFRLTSTDVIHAFWIPAVRFKRDAFPGRTTEFAVTFPERGFIRRGGECAQFCGLLHADMEFDVRVLSQREFRRWVAERRART